MGGVLSEASSATRPARAGRYAWFVAGSLAAAYLLSILDRYLLSVVLEDVKRELVLTDTELGVLQGPSFVLLFLLASIPFGRLADVVSRRLLIAVGLGFWSSATFACGLAETFHQLLAARLAVGLGEAALVPAAMSLIAAYFPREKLGLAIAVYSTGGAFGRAAAFAGGGALFGWLGVRGGLDLAGHHVAPWQGVFLAAGVAGAVFAIIFLLSVREPARERSVQDRGALSAALRHCWRHRAAYLSLFMPFSMVTAIAAQMVAWSVSFYVRRHGLDIATASAIVGFTGLVVGPPANLFGGWFNDWLKSRGGRYHHPLVLTLVLPPIAVGVAIMVFTPSVLVAACAYGAAYAMLSISGATALAGVQLITPDQHRGMTSSFFLIFYTAFGAGFGPFLVGVLSDRLFGGTGDLAASMLTATVLLALAGLPFGLFGYRRFSEKAQADDFAQAH